MVRHDPHELAARIVQNAGGKVVGRSRMQKVTDLARPAGFPAEFGFACRPHGPFSEDRATGLEIASVFADLLDEVRQSDRGAPSRSIGSRRNGRLRIRSVGLSGRRPRRSGDRSRPRRDGRHPVRRRRHRPGKVAQSSARDPQAQAGEIPRESRGGWSSGQ